MDNSFDTEKRNSKRVCFFMGSISGRGGTERVASIIANGLAARGYEIYILSLWEGLNPGFEFNRQIQLYELFSRCRAFKWHYINVIVKLRRFLKKHRIDILIATDSILSLFAIPACVNLRIFHIVWEHFNFLTDFKLYSRRLSRYFAARWSDVIVVLTQQDLQFWNKKVSGRARIISIPNPITYPLADPADRTWNNKLAIAVGRLNYQKGFDLLIQCWKKVSASSPEWKLYIIGEGEDETLLANLIHQEDLDKIIEILPFHHNISDYYKKASIFCLSSRFEGLPMVLLEAQAFALPAVCFDCYTGPAEVVTDGENGFIVPDKDVDAFTAKVIQLTHEPELREAMGLKALSRASEFRQENILNRWEVLLQG
jgi:glycosyltransferase involved in cell wall biosynthesis